MSIITHRDDKAFDKIVWIIFILLALMAIIYYQERVIFLDAAFKFFEISATGDHAVQAYRYGDLIPQFFLWAAIMLDMPLSIALITFSTSYLIFGSAVCLLLIKTLGHSRMATLIPFMLILMSSHSFFWFTNEQFAAYPYLISAWCLFISSKDSFGPLNVKFLMGLLVLSISLITHPLMIVSHLFILLITSLDFRQWAKMNLFIGVWTVGTFILKSSISPLGYDQESMSRLQFDNVIEVITNFGTVGAKQFLDHLFSDLITIPVFLILATYFLYREKHYLKAVLTNLSVIGFCIINIASNPDGGAWFHIGTHYLPIVTMLFFPILYIWESLDRLDKLIFYLALMIIAGVKVGHIVSTSDEYKSRLSYVESMANISPEHNYIIISDDSPLVNRNYQYWALAYETMLYSTVNNSSTSNTLILKDSKDQKWRYDMEGMAMGSSSNYKLSDIKYRGYKFISKPVIYKRISEIQTGEEIRKDN